MPGLSTRLPEDGLQSLLVCPACRGELAERGEALRCDGCRQDYPVVQGVPVLIREGRSAFRKRDFVQDAHSFFVVPEAVRRQSWLPTLDHNPGARERYREFARLLLRDNASPTLLVIGGGQLGLGMDALLEFPDIRIVETDVSLDERTQIICDGHDLPFPDAVFDGVVVQAVLEHVIDAGACVAEIHRVLRPDGVVYSETPFLQPGHMGGYDFRRFTHLGHRSLFRNFEEQDSGIACGPGMMLAGAYQAFLACLTTHRFVRRLLIAWARVTAFWLKYLDRWLVNRPGAYDAASCFYYVGRKRWAWVNDPSLPRGYRGLS
jgi:SAM-dependent methyltransferase